MQIRPRARLPCTTEVQRLGKFFQLFLDCMNFLTLFLGLLLALRGPQFCSFFWVAGKESHLCAFSRNCCTLEVGARAQWVGG